MKTYSLDTNCFISAVNLDSPDFHALQAILDAAARNVVQLRVSLHTIKELSARMDQAFALAETLPKLRNFPIGKVEQQVGRFSNVAGTFDDVRRNESIQIELEALSKAGTSIRDRGGYMDALQNGLDGFVTSDKQLCGNAPKARINAAFQTKVITPSELEAMLQNAE